MHDVSLKRFATTIEKQWFRFWTQSGASNLSSELTSASFNSNLVLQCSQVPDPLATGSCASWGTWLCKWYLVMCLINPRCLNITWQIKGCQHSEVNRVSFTTHTNLQLLCIVACSWVTLLCSVLNVCVVYSSVVHMWTAERRCTQYCGAFAWYTVLWCGCVHGAFSSVAFSTVMRLCVRGGAFSASNKSFCWLGCTHWNHTSLIESSEQLLDALHMAYCTVHTVHRV